MKYRLAAIGLSLLTATALAQVSAITTSSRDSLLLYNCTASDTAPNVTISAYGANAVGGSLLSSVDTVNIEVVDSASEASLISSNRANRQPIRMVVVLDTTSTMPLVDTINAISTQLFPQLEFNDQVALVTFSQNVSPVTAFFTDKNRLVNEYMLGLQVTGGNNRIYDAIQDGVRALGNPPSGTRNVVVVVTDSSRREVAQASLNDIITRANADKIQIYPVALFTQDRPDADELKTLAERTNGYAWVYNNLNDPTSVSALQQGLSTIMNQLVTTLNQEARLLVDLSSVPLQDARDITLKVTVSLTTGTVLSDSITCPAPRVQAVVVSTSIPNTISFVNDLTPITTSQPLDITVNVQTSLPASEQLIVFLQNGQIVQSSKSLTYTFNTPTLVPGAYSITAQLRNLDNTVFATTEGALSVNAQQVLTLNVVDGALNAPDRPVRIESLSNPTIALPDVRFTINPASDTANRKLITGGVVPVQGGNATLTIPNLRAEIQRLFPNTPDATSFEIRAVIPGPAESAPTLAESAPLTFVYTVPPPPPIDTGLALVAALTTALFLLNVLVFFRVGRARVRRMIFRPDGYEMPNRLMAVTVYRDAMKQTNTLTKKTITLGRGSNNDINLGDDNKVSRQHGVIMWRRQEWYYTNRKPDVFVRIGGRRYRGFKLVRLEPVTEIEIGDARVFFHSNSQQDITELTRTNL